MATFLDLSLFGYFSAIFIFIFVFALLFSVLNRWGIFKGVPGEKGVYGLISIAVALIVSMSRDSSLIIASIAPWLTIIIVVLFLLMMMFSMFSGDDSSLMKEAIKSQGVQWTLIVLVVIVVIASLSSTYGQRLLDEQNPADSNINAQNELNNADVQLVETDNTNNNNQVDVTNTGSNSGTAGESVSGAPGSTATNDYGDNFLATIIHPKIMGMLMMFFIAFFTILLIARTPDPAS